MPPEVQTEIATENELPEVHPESEKLPEVEAEVITEIDPKVLRMAEVERKKQELRRRMEAASMARRSKKGFMTPERKKKLRLLLRKKAAEELKKEQERKAEERRWIIEDRCGEPEDLEWASKEDLRDICEYYYQRILECESDKWDIELQIRRKAFEIADLNTKVNDLRGKFQKPILRKVSKYENKFAKLQKKAAEFNFRNQLKMVKRHDFLIKDADDKKSQVDKSEKGTDLTEEEVEKAIEDGADAEKLSTEEGDGEKLLEGDVQGTEEKPRLEGEASEGERLSEEEKLTEEGAQRLEQEGEKPSRVEDDHQEGADGELRVGEGDDQPRPDGVEGEVTAEAQPPVEGEAQPPEPPAPQHTEEDLWLYLKETVTNVHPASVEEFLENLIGTLQQVPEEYLKPVIEANVKRATSPSVTDGEHLVSLEGEIPKEDEVSESVGETVTADTDLAPPKEIATAEGEAVPEETTASAEISSEIPEDHEIADPEASSDLEAAA